MKTAADLIAILFLARDMAHREHLRVTGVGSDARHRALEFFYDGIVDLADEFAEVYQGCYGVIENIPVAQPDKAGADIVKVLSAQLAWIEKNRGAFDKVCDSPLQNIIDEVCAVYLRTLYRLKVLK